MNRPFVSANVQYRVGSNAGDVRAAIVTHVDPQNPMRVNLMVFPNGTDEDVHEFATIRPFPVSGVVPGEHANDWQWANLADVLLTNTPPESAAVGAAASASRD